MARKKKNNVDNVDRAYWLYDSSYITDKWQYCYANNTIVLAWDIIGDYRQYLDQTSIGYKLREFNGQPENQYQKESLAIWNFVSNMKKGDVVFVKNGKDTIVARGIVTGNYDFVDIKGEIFKNRREVRWEKVGNWKIELPDYDCVLWNLNGRSDILFGIDKMVGEIVSEDSKKFWLAVLDSEVLDLKDISSGKIFELPIYAKEINIGDFVVIYDWPKREIVGFIKVSQKVRNKNIICGGGYECTLSMADWSNSKSLDQKTIAFLKNPTDSLIELTTDQFNSFVNINRLKGTDETCLSYTEEDFKTDVFMSQEQLNKLVKLIQRKKNIILQGPPGVGKTYSAKRLAYVMMGEKNDSRVECVQFHQNYSYEDFIMGYKPSENGTFNLNTGIFYDFCKKAATDRSHSYFFIIDEINRGNLSKIFGELLQLIEADYRDSEIKLAYKKDEAFFVPSNIYIIGMMNTADRSLAMIDYALRRRFSFFDMYPGFDTEGFVNYKKERKSKYLNILVDSVKEVNKMILEDDSLGKGFLLGHSYIMQESENFDRDMAESIIECDLIPLIEEYWFDNISKVNSAKEILRKVLSDDYR